MGFVDYILIGVLLLVVAGAAFAVWRAKKSGKKCIGCPDSGACAGNCTGNCSGCCSHPK